MSEQASEPIGQRVITHAAPGIDVWALPLGVPEVVSFSGSIQTDISLEGADRVRLRAAARLLDRGNEKLDRFEIADWLEGRGAEMQFSADGARLDFSGRALCGDLPDVIDLAAGLLRTPRFDPDEVEKVKRELIAGVRRASTDTAYLSSASLRRALYPPNHPGWSQPLDEQLQEIEALDAAGLARFYEAACRRRPVRLALAGDLAEVAISDLIPHFSERTAGRPRTVNRDVGQPAPGRTNLHVPDKANVDITMGCGISIRRGDALYQPLRVGVFALGGNFSARLMQEVRDRQGLTYGIRASLREITTDTEGHFEVSATFSPDQLDRGLQAAGEVVAAWHKDGCTDEEISRVKETLLGTYDVGLSTTRALASVMLSRMEEGFAPDYLDTYRDEIASVTAPEVNQAVRATIEPSQFQSVATGTFAEEEVKG